MSVSNTNARDAVSVSTKGHRFPWKWNLTDLESVEKNGLKVFFLPFHVAAVLPWVISWQGMNCSVIVRSTRE